MQRVEARAKINLALNVEGKSDRMHSLSGVYVSCALCDVVTLSARTDGEINVRYVDGGGYENDTAYAMARALQVRYGTSGVDIVIKKRIPERCGLGGSSADAAGVAEAFSREFSLGKIDRGLLLSVGSDVPFQYEGGAAVVGGTGDDIRPVRLPKLFLVVLCPDKGVSTAECFSLYDKIGGERGDVEGLVRTLSERKTPAFFNSLERAATTLVEEIGVGKRILTSAGFACGMTGSGSALFGTEYDEVAFREKLKNVVLPEGFTLLTTTTEANL